MKKKIISILSVFLIVAGLVCSGQSNLRLLADEKPPIVESVRYI